MSLESLFTPFQNKTLSLKNRFVMAPMQRYFARDGVIPSAEFAAYFRRRSEGGVGLVLTEMCAVERPVSYVDPAAARFWGEASLNAWRQVVSEVHDVGGLIGLQIGHVGATAHPLTGWRPDGVIDSPSGIDNAGQTVGEAMTEEAIADTIAAFACAAANGKALGFDAVEIHGGHGGVIDQFAWNFTNRRNDRWGGDMAQRAHFGAEVIRAVREAVGPDYPVIVRLSQWKIGYYDIKVAPTRDELAAWVEPLATAGVDIFHGSQRHFWEPEFEGSDLNFAGWIKKITGLPTITVGSVGLSNDFMNAFNGEDSKVTGLDELIRRYERGDFDLVAVGRSLLQDPYWVQKVKEGRFDELKAFEASSMSQLY